MVSVHGWKLLKWCLSQQLLITVESHLPNHSCSLYFNYGSLQIGTHLTIGCQECSGFQSSCRFQIFAWILLGSQPNNMRCSKIETFFQCHARGFKSFRSCSILSFIFLDEGCSPVFTLWGTILKCYPKNWPSTGERSFTNTRLLPASISPYHTFALPLFTIPATSELYVNILPCS